MTPPPIAAASFRRVIGAEVVSNFGSMMSRLAIPWLAVLSLGATPFEMGLLALADVCAGALAALGLGVFVDRRRKRAVMIGTDLARMVLLAALAIAAAFDSLGLSALVVAAASSGVLTMAFELARSAWLAQAAARDDIGRRNAQLVAGTAISEALAFAIAGALFQWLGGVVALLVDAASYLLSALLLRGVQEPARAAAAATPSRPASVAADMRQALRVVLQRRELRTLLLLEVLVAASVGVAGTSYMIYVSRDLAIGTALLGVVFALGGVGSAIGAALAPRLARSAGEGRALAAGLGLFAAGSLLVPLAGEVGAIAAVVLLASQQLVGDAGYAGYSIQDRTLRQTLAPPELLAGVDASIRSGGQLALLAAALLGGVFASTHGARAGLWLAAALAGAAALVAMGGFTPAAPRPVQAG